MRLREDCKALVDLCAVFAATVPTKCSQTSFLILRMYVPEIRFLRSASNSVVQVVNSHMTDIFMNNYSETCDEIRSLGTDTLNKITRTS
jgi:hypothetical protein